MEQQTVRKTDKYQLMPTAAQETAAQETAAQETAAQETAAQEQARAFVLRRCCELYNAALQERRDAWQTCGGSITVASQSAQLPASKAVRPEYRDIYSQVLQDVLTRLDRAFQAFFRRVQAGEQPGYPRFQGVKRYTSFTYKQFGNGATLDNGLLVRSKLGRVAVRWSRPLEGRPKTVTISNAADGWSVSFSCAAVPTHPLPPTGRETGSDVGLPVFLITAEGEATENPRHQRKAEKQLKKAQRRVSRRTKGSRRRKKAVTLLARKHQQVQRQRADFHHKTALVRELNTTRSLSSWKTCGSPTWYGTVTSPNASAMRAGDNSAPSSKVKQSTLAVESSPCHPPLPARTVQAAASVCPRA